MKLPWKDGIPKEEKLSWAERREKRSRAAKVSAAQGLFKTFSEDQKLQLLDQISKSRALMPLISGIEQESGNHYAEIARDLTIEAIINLTDRNRRTIMALDKSEQFALVSNELREMEQRAIDANRSTKTGIKAEGGLTAGKYTEKLPQNKPRSL